MPAIKRKAVFKQVKHDDETPTYVVVELVNMARYKIGEKIEREHIDGLITEGIQVVIR